MDSGWASPHQVGRLAGVGDARLSCTERRMQNHVLGDPSILCVEEEWPRLDGTEHSSCSTDGVSRSLRMSGAKRAICPAGLRAWRLTNTLVSGAGLNSSKSWLCHRSNLCLVAKQTSKSVVLTGRWHESQCEIHPPHKEAQRPGSLGPSQGPSRQ